jgi:hypothetical protein
MKFGEGRWARSLSGRRAKGGRWGLVNARSASSFGGGEVSTLALSLFFTAATIGSDGSPVVAGAPALTYSGTSHKRQWNPDGVLEYAPHNLLDYTYPNNANRATGIGITDTTVNDKQGVILNGQSTSAYWYRNPSSNIQIGDTYVIKLWVQLVDVSDTEPVCLGSSTAGDYALNFAGATSGIPVSSVRIPGTDVWEHTFERTALSATFFGPLQYTGNYAINNSRVAFSNFRIMNKNSDTSVQIDTNGAAVYAARAGERNRKPATNLLTYPEQFDNAVWSNIRATVSGGQADPFGGTNAFKLVENSDAGISHYHRSTEDWEAGKTYTYSRYVAAGERSLCWIQMFGSTSYDVWFDVASGEVLTKDALIIDAKIIPVAGTDYFRVMATAVAPSSGSGFISFGMADTDGSITYDGDGSSGLYIFGAMLNEGGIEDYVGGTDGDAWYTAGEPTTGFVKCGWTREGAAATNLETDSEDFSSSVGWVAVSATYSANAETAPDGNAAADEYDFANGTSYIYRTYAVAAETTYVWSVFRRIGTLVDEIAAVYDASNAAFITTDAAKTIVPVGNGMARMSITFSTPVGCTSVRVYPVRNPTTGGTAVYWGAQLETGTYPSSYIKTSGGTSTRAAETCSMPMAEWYNPAEGTFVADYSYNDPNDVGFTFGRAKSLVFRTSRTGDSEFTNQIGMGRFESYGSSQPTTLNCFVRDVSGSGDDVSSLNLADDTVDGVSYLRRNYDGARRFKSALCFGSVSTKVSDDTSVAEDATTFSSGIEMDTVHFCSAYSNVAQTNSDLRSLQFYNKQQGSLEMLESCIIDDDGTSWIDEQMAA